MPGSLKDRVLSSIDAAMATLAEGFVRRWSRLERGYRRPLSWLVRRVKFAFYPLLALAAIGWLVWDWTHARSLSAAENAIFDTVVKWRPFEPQPSGQVVVVDIDECSIEFFRSRGEGGWPWSRQRQADLLEELDRAGVRAVGFDVLFIDRSQVDPDGDRILEAMAEGGGGRFVFESTRLHPDYDEGSSLRASQAPGAFALSADPHDDPFVALRLPYGRAMARYSAAANVARDQDGVLRDLPLHENGWRLGAAVAAAAAGHDGNARSAAAFRDHHPPELAPGNASAANQRGGPVDRWKARLSLRDDRSAAVARTRGADRFHRIRTQRCEADAGRSGDAGCRSHGGSHRSVDRQQRHWDAACGTEIRDRDAADRVDRVGVLPRGTGQEHRLRIRRGEPGAARDGVHRPHVLRFLLRYLCECRLRQRGIRCLPAVCRGSARTRGR